VVSAKRDVCELVELCYALPTRADALLATSTTLRI